ncbi:MerR family transcriptional regulator [Paraclostridium sordellii]|uniref:MerR family transcriptional regulator n=2 Tax=Paraclostridium sordellii TaxID=1505 RepID=UPI000E4EFD5B|nr:MerR family transcriptional regulator [Paeniclostridium sordellii]RGX04639.1 MerR family transcriptional regulator [Paeniclostridium sordellii]
MENYFTIGEISKLSSISLKTLRYYDEFGLLKPKYVNKENNYRYYSIEQLTTIDLIKLFKSTGMALALIKEILNSQSNLDFMVQNIRNQSKVIEKKIKELSQIKKHLDCLDKEISQNIGYGLNKVFIKYNKRRNYLNYDLLSNSPQELDLNLRDVMLDLDKKKYPYSVTLGSTVSYKNLKEEDKIIYKGFKVFTEKSKDTKYLEEGDYITIIYEGCPCDSIIYYKKLLDYINKNNIEVVGDFNETWIVGKIDENLDEKSLIKLDILKK